MTRVLHAFVTTLLSSIPGVHLDQVTVEQEAVRPVAKRSDDAHTYLHQLCQVDACIARAYALSQAFLALMRERRGNELQAWRAEATRSGIGVANKNPW